MRMGRVALGLVLMLAQGLAAQSSADSLYRLGRLQIAQGEYSLAASTLSQVLRRFPASARIQDAAYWAAFALYRRAGEGDLNRARELLTPPSPAAGHPDAATLAVRIGSLLGAAPASVPRCTPANGAVYAATLQAAGQAASIAPARAALRDPTCPVVGRRSAAIVLGQMGGAENWAALRLAAQTDADGQLRAEAITWLRQDRSREALEVVVERAAHDPDRRAAQAAASVLPDLAHPDTRVAIYGFLRDSAIEDSRRQAVVSWSRLARVKPSVDSLRAIFPLVATQGSLGSSMLEVIDALGGDRDKDWIWAQVQDQTLPTLARLTGLQRVGQRRSVAELVALFDGSEVRLMKYGVLEQLRGHPDAAAARALREIIQTEPSPLVRAAAEAALAGRR